MIADIVAVMLGEDCIFSYQSKNHVSLIEARLIGASALASLKDISPNLEEIRDAVFAGRIVRVRARPLTVGGRVKRVDCVYEPIVAESRVAGIIVRARVSRVVSPEDISAGRAVLATLEAELAQTHRENLQSEDEPQDARCLPPSDRLERDFARRLLVESLRRIVPKLH